MKKNYITPKSLVADIEFAEFMLIGMSNTEANPEYEGGGDAKARIVDFSDEDMF